jgi:hypothetical protein
MTFAESSAWERKLKDARVRVEVHRCAANHAFANEMRIGENVLPFAEYNATGRRLRGGAR